MILCNHDDHNVITTALETLQFLLTTPPEQIVIKLDSSSGLSSSYDIEVVNSVCDVGDVKRMDVYEHLAQLKKQSLGNQKICRREILIALSVH